LAKSNGTEKINHMCKIEIFTFNAFQENTYVLYDETKECVIIDPGCSTRLEEKRLVTFIESNGLKPVRLLMTHGHIDHMLGNWYISDKYQLEVEIHRDEVVVLNSSPQIGQMYGIPVQPSPEATKFIEEGDLLTFGNTTLKALLTPGHSPASISFYCEAGNFVIGGDVLFRQSIGRTDLPGGNFDTLINSIKTQLYPLGDAVKVFPGHGPDTTIGYEKKYNPFLNQ
jgi:hydroxyacylglutathione hydrolase